MSKGSRPDPRRRKKDHPPATYLKIPNGGKEEGYMAGEIYGCYSHRTHATQPCIEDITKGQHKCPWCKAGMVSEWRGWVPIWDADWCLRYVLINESYFPSVDAIKHRSQVECSRAKNPISPCIVRDKVNHLRSLPDRPPWSVPVNMLEVCLTLWKCELLVKWFQKNPLEETRPADEVMRMDDGKPYSPAMQSAARKWIPKKGDGAELLDPVQEVNRLKAHATLVDGKNGHSKKGSD